MARSFLDTSIGYSMNMGAVLLKRELIAIFKKNGFDVTPEQWAILSRLSESNGVNQNELALITFKDNANITRIVDKLVNKKLVEKRQDDNDGRAWRVYITRSGQTMVSRLQPLAVEVLKKASAGISKQDIDSCNRIVQKIITNLQ